MDGNVPKQPGIRGRGFENKLSRFGEFEKLGEVKIDLQRVRGYKSNKGSQVSCIFIFLFSPRFAAPPPFSEGGFTYVSNVVTVSLEGDNLSRSDGRHGIGCG